MPSRRRLAERLRHRPGRRDAASRARHLSALFDAATVADLEAALPQSAAEAADEVLAEGIPADRIEVRRSLELRYRGVEQSLGDPEPADGPTTPAAFAAEHQRLYGYMHAGRRLEIVAARVEVVGRSRDVAACDRHRVGAATAQGRSARRRSIRRPLAEAQVFDRGAACARRRDRRPGDRRRSRRRPRSSIPAGRPKCSARANCCWTRAGDDASAQSQRPTGVRPTRRSRSCWKSSTISFAGIAEQMGITLRNTASSVNVKERLDFSCAIFTAAGDLVVNAPHIPVHLGAMGETVTRVLADNPQLAARRRVRHQRSLSRRLASARRDGRHAGSRCRQGQLLFFTASRAHHAEIGGIVPGSMPPFSRNLAEEGVLIRNFKLVDRRRAALGRAWRVARCPAPYPSRDVADNLADVAAQVAANGSGARDLDATGRALTLARRRGLHASTSSTRPSRKSQPGTGPLCRRHAHDSSTIWTTARRSPWRSIWPTAGPSFDFTGTGPVWPAT